MTTLQLITLLQKFPADSEVKIKTTDRNPKSSFPINFVIDGLGAKSNPKTPTLLVTLGTANGTYDGSGYSFKNIT